MYTYIYIHTYAYVAVCVCVYVYILHSYTYTLSRNVYSERISRVGVGDGRLLHCVELGYILRVEERENGDFSA